MMEYRKATWKDALLLAETKMLACEYLSENDDEEFDIDNETDHMLTLLDQDQQTAYLIMDDYICGGYYCYGPALPNETNQKVALHEIYLLPGYDYVKIASKAIEDVKELCKRHGESQFSCVCKAMNEEAIEIFRKLAVKETKNKNGDEIIFTLEV